MTKTKSDYNERSLGGYSDWRERMADAVRARNEKYETILCGSFDLTHIPEGETVIVGSFSCTWMSAKKRYLKRKYVLDIGFGPQSPGDVARDYLKAKFGRGSPVRKSKNPESAEFLPMPAYAEPGALKGNWVYVDVEAAFATVMRLAGWSCMYRPDRYLGRGGSILDFPALDNKMCRNLLVTCGMPGKIYLMSHWGPFSRKTYNPLLNGHLHRLVSDCHHLLAGYALDECEARYVFTDGCIIPERALEKYQAFARSIGFNTKLESGIGRGYIKALGAYKLPGKTTKSFDRYNRHASFKIRHVSSFLTDKLRWLKDFPVWPKEDSRK